MQERKNNAILLRRCYKFKKDRKMKFRKTKTGIAICPFFIWNCIHPKNVESYYEGNCQEKLCPLSEGSNKRAFATESVLLVEMLIDDFIHAGHPVCPGCGVYIDEDSHEEDCGFSRLLDLKGKK